MLRPVLLRLLRKGIFDCATFSPTSRDTFPSHLSAATSYVETEEEQDVAIRSRTDQYVAGLSTPSDSWPVPQTTIAESLRFMKTR